MQKIDKINRLTPKLKNKNSVPEFPNNAENQFCGYFENLPAMIYSVEPVEPYRSLYISPAFETLGYPLEEWQNGTRLWERIIHAEDRNRIVLQTKAAMKSGEETDFEYRMIAKDGTVRWYQDRGCLVKNKADKKVYWQGIILDITAKKQIEAEAKKAADAYKTIAGNIPNSAIVTFDKDLRYTLAEGVQLVRDKFTPEMFVGKTLFEVFPPKISDEWEKHYKIALAGGYLSFEKENRNKHYKILVLPIKDEKGEIHSGLTVWQDITEQKKSEIEIKESEVRHRELFENANDVIYTHDLKGNFTAFNKTAEIVFGYSAEESLKLNISQIVLPKHFKIAQRKIKEKLQYGKTETSYEIECVSKNNRKIILEVNSRPIYKDGKIVAIQGIARDVTERKQTEAALKQSELRLRMLFENASDLIYSLDLRGNFTSINKATEKLFGYSEKEVKKLNFSQIVLPKYAEIAQDLMCKKLSGLEKTVFEIECVTKHGQIVTLEVNSSPIFKNRRVIGIQGFARDITERKISELALKENEENYRELFENANDLIYTIDLKGNFTSFNRVAEIVTGYTREEIIHQNINFSKVVAPEFMQIANESLARKLTNDASTRYELEIINKKGERIPLELSSRLILKNGKPVGVQGIGRNISDRKKHEQSLKSSENKYRTLSEGIMHQVWTATPEGLVNFVNQRTLDYFNVDETGFFTGRPQEFIYQDDIIQFTEKWTNSLKTGENFEAECRLIRHDGVLRWFKARGTAERTGENKIVKWFGTNTDIHDQKMAEARLNHFAKHDTLTKLPNRIEFMNHLTTAIETAQNNNSVCFAVLFLDLDRFKLINDSLGHIVGDKLLCKIAERLSNCVRPRDVVARLGGDEFTILLNRCGTDLDVKMVAERIQKHVSEPYKINNYEIFTSASIGVVMLDDTNRTPEDYLRDADTAMYSAKESGKAHFEIFNSEMHTRNMNLLSVENDLRRAVERNELRVFYQPVVDLNDGSISEFEALIRWQHPTRGLVPPNDFIGVAEETGMIIEIGQWILEESCRQTVLWQKQFTTNKPLSISVNLSAKQLMHPMLISQIEEILRKTGLNPHSLKLEVTESMVMKQPDLALQVLNRIREIGVSLSTDDFGTGYSSLSYLHRFPFDRLKIDRSFVGEMDVSRKSGEIVRSILTLAENLGFDVVAEGIETLLQYKQLQQLNCPNGQGYYFSKPVPANEAEKLLGEKDIVKSMPIVPIFNDRIIEYAKVQ